jgi:hypothetical protein
MSTRASGRWPANARRAQRRRTRLGMSACRKSSDVHAVDAAVHEAVAALVEAFPRHTVTLFLAEDAETAPGRNVVVSYASTAVRNDMVAALRAFLAWDAARAGQLVTIDDDPPTSTRQ